MDTPAIRTEALHRRYRKGNRSWFRRRPEKEREFVALNDVHLEVRPGELFGLLGPNGAGKTTLIKILTTLLAPSQGRAWVLGLDVVDNARAIRPRINMVSGGESSGYGILTVRENLWLFSRIYGVPADLIAQRVETMLEVVGLKDKAASRISHLSTGQRQKMNFCRGFITDPRVLFLDEPTLGLDVTSARAIRAFLRQWMAERPERTLLLTTHYMAEADELCDRLAIMDQGKLLACDTPANLKRRVQRYPLYELKLSPGWNRGALLAQLPGVHTAVVEDQTEHATVKLALEHEAAIGAAVQAVVSTQGKILNLTKTEPTLEDVFIELVGHGLNEPATPPLSRPAPR